MRTEAFVVEDRRSAPRSRSFKAGDRVALPGAVLRVLEGEDRTPLVLVKANREKLRILAGHFKDGNKLKGGDQCFSRAP